jgi:hypothetical protein
MTPEILNESNALIIKIKAAMEPIDEAKNNPDREYMAVGLANTNDSSLGVRFLLKPEQIEIVKVLVLSMANQNLAEMTAEFEAL